MCWGKGEQTCYLLNVPSVTTIYQKELFCTNTLFNYILLRSGMCQKCSVQHTPLQGLLDTFTPLEFFIGLRKTVKFLVNISL
ncbi:hypothetical protein C0J52_05981 [Blattella germanica]|nr:hypothetical protein C0J52_05981 [Blattella germanica]